MAKTVHPMVGLLEAGYVQKDKENTFHHYKYASDESVTRKMRDTMRTHNLFPKSCEIVRLDHTEVKNAKGEILQHFIVVARFILSDDSGTEYGPFDGVGSAMDKGDKAAMKAMTAARKYALSQAALVSWGDDPEADDSVDKAMADGAAANGRVSAAATKAIEAGKVEAPKGVTALKQVWDKASAAVKKELAQSDEWNGLKAVAQNAEKVTA